MSTTEKIIVCNVVILIVYSIIIDIVVRDITTMAISTTIGILLHSVLCVGIAITFYRSKKHNNDIRKLHGKSYLLSAVTILCVGFPTCSLLTILRL